VLTFAAFRKDKHPFPQAVKVRLTVGRNDWLHPSTALAARKIDARQNCKCAFSLHKGLHRQMWWPKERACKCGSALAHAILTDRTQVPAATRQKLGILIDKYFV